MQGGDIFEEEDYEETVGYEVLVKGAKAKGLEEEMTNN